MREEANGLRIRLLGLVVLAGILVPRAVPAGSERSAIVCFLEGQARITEPGGKAARDLSLFDWLEPGAVLETDEGARLVLAFARGDRYELKGRTKAFLTAEGLVASSGKLSKLPSVPALPQVLALAADSKPGSQLPAIRLRGLKALPADLYPADGAAVLAETATLSFGPVAGAERYRVELEDAVGTKLLAVETSSTSVAVSPGILKPGAGYFWSVRALGRTASPGVADAEFATLTEEQAGLREAFRGQAGSSKDADQLLLLARLESVLGLRKEARATLREALAQAPRNAEIKKALEAMDRK